VWQKKKKKLKQCFPHLEGSAKIQNKDIKKTWSLNMTSQISHRKLNRKLSLE
jgi:hypothetical protein